MPLNYIGSKRSLLPVLEQVFTKEIQNLDETLTLGDGFCGTGSVGHYFTTTYGVAVHSVDMERYSHLINVALLTIPYSDRIKSLISILNQNGSRKGLLSQHYSPAGNRMFFTEENAGRIDHIRHQIDTMTLSDQERIFLLASLVYSADKVANVSCVYGSFLKSFKTTATKPFSLLPLHTDTTQKNPKNHAESGDVVLTDWSDCDAVYFDPPYNARQYGANYFLLNDIIQNRDKQSEMRPKTGLTNYYKSDFCKKSTVKQAFQSLLDNPTLPHTLFISYNNEGLLSQTDLQQLLLQYGSVTLYKYPYKKFKAQQSVSNTHVFEFVWCIHTNRQPTYSEYILPKH